MYFLSRGLYLNSSSILLEFHVPFSFTEKLKLISPVSLLTTLFLLSFFGIFIVFTLNTTFVYILISYKVGPVVSENYFGVGILTGLT